jgi:hypothetical protein
VASWNIGGGLLQKLNEIEDLIRTKNIDILTIVEAESTIQGGTVLIGGYKTFLPLVKTSKDKMRMLTLVTNELVPNIKLRTDLMSPSLPSPDRKELIKIITTRYPLISLITRNFSSITIISR